MRPKTEIAFMQERDDTDENREIVALVEERSEAPRADDRDLDQLVIELGYDPRDFLPA